MSRAGAVAWAWVSAWSWLERHPVRALGACFALAILLRAPFLALPFESDEGGYLMVADQWHGKGEALYTDQWVDRPPILLVVFKLAEFLGGAPATVRMMSICFGILLITAAWSAGRMINGAKGAVAAAVVATAVSSSYSFHGFALTGEAIAGTFVMISCALVLKAKYGDFSPQSGIVVALAAGIFACLACLTKQNFIDAGVFAFVLLVVTAHKTWKLIVAYGVGVAIPIFATATWALSDDGPGLSRLWVAMFRFRQRALNVIQDASLEAPLSRLKWLAVLFLISGLALLFVQLFVAARRVEGRHSLRIALVMMSLYVALSILVGASWWTHYLLQLASVLSMGAALATRLSLSAIRLHFPASITVASSIVATLIGVGELVAVNVPSQHDEIVADFLRSASPAGDSVVLAYGSPNIIEMADLTTPYRYSWSLPIRTRDPHLRDLVGVLSSVDAPTWLVEIGDFDWWGLDNAAFEDVRTARYHLAATVCGHDIYLLDDVSRELPPTPACP